MSALTISSSVTATVPPPERRSAASTSRVRTGFAMAVPSAMVGRASMAMKSSASAAKLA